MSGFRIRTISGIVLLLVVGSLVSCRSRGTIPADSSVEQLRVWERESNSGMPIIRVLLNEPTGTSVVRCSSRQPLTVQLLGDSDVTRTVEAGTTLTFRRRGQQVQVAGRTFSGPSGFRVWTGEKGTIRTAGRTYRGSLRIYLNDQYQKGVEDGGLMVVNHLPINKYLWSVLGGELLPDWNGAAINRTQAVAARTYTLYEMKKREEERDARFDLFDSQRSQVYGGTERERPSTRRGVEDTIGKVVIYDGNRYVPAYFSSTCGGHTSPPRENFAWHEGPVPPPLEGIDCPWDGVSKHHRWRARISGNTLRRVLFPQAKGQSVYDVAVVDRLSEDRVDRIAFRLQSGDVERLSGPGFRRKIASYRSSLKSDRDRDRVWIRSTKFRVRKTGNGTFEFRGKGWGHGVGLCQYGAFGASQEGYGYMEILRHYYQTSSVKRLYPVRP